MFKAIGFLVWGPLLVVALYDRNYFWLGYSLFVLAWCLR